VSEDKEKRIPPDHSEKKVSPGLEEALSKVDGNKSRLARLCGVTPQSVGEWFEKGIVPPRHAKKIEDCLGVKRRKLNPEVFG